MGKVIDLSHELNQNTPVFPGTKVPIFTPTASIEEVGYRELFISFQSHTGTHIDTPAHLLSHGKSLSDFSIEKFCGKAYVLKHSTENPITIEIIDKMAGILHAVDFVLIQTNWDRFWSQKSYFDNYPIVSIDALNHLCKFKLKGIGVDAISVDPINSKDLPNHNLILLQEMIIIENLTNLSIVSNKVFDFYCLPLPITNGDGSPIRAIAQLIA